MRSCSSYRRTSRRALVAALLCGALAWIAPDRAQESEKKSDLDFKAASGEQSTAPRQSDFVERSRVTLALVEAVVLDGKGRHVRGLPPGAFILLINGQEVPVLTVDEIDLAAPPRPATPGPVEAPPADQPSPAASPDQAADAALAQEARLEAEARQSGPRWFAMIFDGYNNVSPRRMGQSRSAAKKWLDTNLREQDMVAVFEINPYLHSIIGFTNDVPAVKDAINDVRVFPASYMGDEMMEQKLDPNNMATREYLEEQLLNAATFSADLLQAEREQFYANLLEVADAMRDLRGSRAVVLFSGGFPLTMTRSTVSTGGFTPRFKNMLQDLEANGVRVFSFDIGEEGGFTSAEEATNYRLAVDQLGLGSQWLDDMQLGMQKNALNAHREILSVLGNETGGRFWRNRDYAAGLEATNDDLSHYYLVGFRPSSSGVSRRDYQHLKLKADYEGKSLKVISRRGRFKTTAEEAAARQNEADRAAAAARAAEQAPIAEPSAAPAPLELFCRPSFHPASNGQTLVVLPVQVAGPVESISIGSGVQVLDFEVIVSASVDGNEVAQGQRNVRMQIPDAAAEHLTGGVQIRDAVLLPPLTLDLEVVVRLNGQNRSGSWRTRLNVPGRDSALFGLTDLTLLHPTQPVPLVYDVFIKGDEVFGTEPPAVLADPLGAEAQGRPPLYLEGAFPRKIPLIAQVRVTAPPPPSAELRSPLGMDWELLPAAGGDPLAPPVRYRRLQLIENGGQLDVMVDLDLSQVEPGDYTLRLTARNLVEEGEAVRSFPITVAP